MPEGENDVDIDDKDEDQDYNDDEDPESDRQVVDNEDNDVIEVDDSPPRASVS